MDERTQRLAIDVGGTKYTLALFEGRRLVRRELLAPLRSELERQNTAWSRARIDVVQAALGDDSVLHGANELAGTGLET